MSDVLRLVVYAWGIGLIVMLATLAICLLAKRNGAPWRGSLFSICQVALIYGMGMAVVIYTFMELYLGRLK